jgi:restriction endonuclease BglII
VKYATYDWHGARRLLAGSPEYADIEVALDRFAFRDDHFAPDVSRRNRSLFVIELQAVFKEMGWAVEVLLGTHHVDCVKGRVALEIEWHSTDKSFPRDILNFEQLRRAGHIDVGVIITRSQELRAVFRRSGKRDHSSTSHIAKLQSAMSGTNDGDCPVLAVALDWPDESVSESGL